MQKLRSKLGLVVVLSCLTLAVGLMASTGSASANGGRHPHVSRISPRISMKVLSGHFKFHGHYVQRVVLSGVGFDTCDSCANAAAYNGCDGSCNSGCDACSASCPYYSYETNVCGNNCQACDAPSGNSCANYNACSTDGSNGYSSCPSNCGSTTGNIGGGSISGNGSASCPSNCGSTDGNIGSINGNGHPACSSHCGSTTGNIGVGTSNNSHPSCSSNCGSTTGNFGVGTDGGNGSPACPSNCDGTAGNAGIGISGNGSPACPSNCGNTTGNVGVGSTNGAPCASYNACGSASSCDCANVQSNLRIYGQDANLSQVPLNAFGEFRVTVLVLVPAHSSRAHYRMWAIDRYNNDCSNILNGSQSW
jgi:hypothetical protein